MMGVGVGWVTQVIECFDFRLWVPMRAAVAGGTVMLAAQRFSGVFPHSLPRPCMVCFLDFVENNRRTVDLMDQALCSEK